MTMHDPDFSTPWLVAHRGAMAEAPENTLIAFDAALKYPVDGIEFDIQLSEDGVPVVFHDDTLGRITGRTGTVGDYSYDVLKEFDYGRWFSERFAGLSIPSLEEVLQRYAGRSVLLIELKTGGMFSRNDRRRRKLVERTLEVIDRAVSSGQKAAISILSFDADALDVINQTAPDLKCILNLNRPGKTVAGTDDFIKGFGLPLRKLTRSFSDEAHGAGKLVMTYSCDTPDQVDAALHAGADFVLTDAPAQVAAYFDEFIRLHSDKSNNEIWRRT